MWLAIKTSVIKACFALSLCSGPQHIVFEGDSLISTESANSWPVLLKNSASGIAEWHFLAKSGSTASEVLARLSLEPYKPKINGGAIFFVSAGTNDLRSPNPTSSKIYSDLKRIWANARKNGFQVYAVTVHSIPCSELCEDERIKLNAAIRSDPSLYDYLVPLDTLFPSMIEEGMFLDKIHFDALGNDRVIDFVRKSHPTFNSRSMRFSSLR